MDAVGSASLTEPPWGDGPGRSARDDLAEPNGAERHPGHLPVLASDHVRLGALVVVLEHADRFAEEPVRQLELEGHTLADVLGRDEVLSAHGAVAYPTAQRGSSASRFGSSRMATSAPNAGPALPPRAGGPRGEPLRVLEDGDERPERATRRRPVEQPMVERQAHRARGSCLDPAPHDERSRLDHAKPEDRPLRRGP